MMKMSTNISFSRYFGATFMIIGLCIGGGMIAIPMVSYQYGVITATFSIILTWLVTFAAAWIVIDMLYQFNYAIDLPRISKITFGKLGSTITWLFYVLLMYAGLSAYISGGGSILSILIIPHLSTQFSIPTLNILSILGFTALFSFIVCRGTACVDWVNRVFLSVKLISFLIAAVILFQHIHIEFHHFSQPHLNNEKAHHHLAWTTILPVLVLSFIYHQILPTLKAYLNCSRAQLKKLTFIASSIPLILYLIWLWITLGTLPFTGTHSFTQVAADGNTAGEFLFSLTTVVHKPIFTLLSDVFYSTAVTTSFLGTALALYYCNRDTYQLHQKPKLNYLLTFSLPTLAVLFFPQLFVIALNYAGFFGAVLFIIIPSLLSLRQHSIQATTMSQSVKLITLCLLCYGFYVSVVTFI